MYFILVVMYVFGFEQPCFHFGLFVCISALSSEEQHELIVQRVIDSASSLANSIVTELHANIVYEGNDEVERATEEGPTSSRPT